MAQEKATVHPINDAASQPPEETKPTKSKPTQVLPSERIVVLKQLALLRAYAAASTHENKPVKTTDVASVGKTSSTTVSLCNAFFIDTGLIQKTEAGFVPSAEVMAFAKAHEWNAEKAAHKLAPLMAATWFGKELQRKLAYDKMLESEAIADLGQMASAGMEYKNQVKFLIDYMEAAGLLIREGDYVRKAAPSSVAAPTEKQSTAHPTQTEHREAQGARSSVSTAFTQMTGGMVQFNISVKVDMQEFSGWEPERIRAFFAGMAQVLAAKNAVEDESSRE